jgi:hypothetical protein
MQRGIVPITISALLLALLMFMIACNGDSSDTNVSSNLSQAEIDALHEFADRQPAEGRLTPAIPLYFPAGLDPSQPEASGGPTGITLRFGAAPPIPGRDPVAIILDLSQGSRGITLYEPPFIDLNGIQASEESTNGDTTASHSLQFDFGDRGFYVGIEWEASDGALTDDMKSETKLVALSVIADARDRGLVHENE